MVLKCVSHCVFAIYTLESLHGIQIPCSTISVLISHSPQSIFVLESHKIIPHLPALYKVRQFQFTNLLFAHLLIRNSMLFPFLANTSFLFPVRETGNKNEVLDKEWAWHGIGNDFTGLGGNPAHL